MTTARDVLVLGAAVVRDGRVLATRRTHPPEAAGRWELPGGKVEPGEDATDAVTREVREELGVTVHVTRMLAGAQPVRPGYVLQVAVAVLVEGEPVPVEHDMLRWLGPEELGQVAWLGPDLPFLPELRRLLLDGEPLEGGNVGGATRVGRTVRRPVGRWTPAVHRVLRRAHSAGVPHVPAVLGIDDRGREVLSYLPGRVVDVDRGLLTDAQLAATARWLRLLHEAMDGAVDPGPWRWFDVPEATVIGHNDVAPYNLCFEGDALVGVFDWDLAGPTTPALELAQLAWTGVPLYREGPDAEVARRLRLLTDAYAGGRGGPGPVQVLDAVTRLKELGVAGIRGWIAAGDPAGVALAAVGEPERTETALTGWLGRRPAVEEALR